MVEQLTLNQLVCGSSPHRGTILRNKIPLSLQRDFILSRQSENFPAGGSSKTKTAARHKTPRRLKNKLSIKTSRVCS
jgi:hypothetical protein